MACLVGFFLLCGGAADGYTPLMDIVVIPDMAGGGTGVLVFGDFRCRCALGRSGVAPGKREGDGATPLGRFSLRRVFFRPDRLSAPRTILPVAPLTPEDGWCDDPSDFHYNQPVTIPHGGHCETLWRELSQVRLDQSCFATRVYCDSHSVSGSYIGDSLIC